MWRNEIASYFLTNTISQKQILLSTFLFYKYKFEQTNNENLFVHDGSCLDSSKLNDKLRKTLDLTFGESTDKSLSLFANVKNKQSEYEPELYENQILFSADGISLLELRNNKTKAIMPKNGHEEEKVGHHPICLVILDTRPDSMYILVQKSNAFQNERTVVDLITDYCNRTLGLRQLGWTINTELRICKGEIWDVVRSRLSGGRNRVKSLVIKFEEQRSNPENEVDRVLQLMLGQLGFSKGELKYKSTDPAKKLLDETNANTKQIIDLLIENKYRMNVGFEKGGTLEYGKNAQAVYGIEDRVIKDFGKTKIFNEDGNLVFELVEWLDTILPDDSAHEYIPTHEKRRRHNG